MRRRNVTLEKDDSATRKNVKRHERSDEKKKRSLSVRHEKNDDRKTLLWSSEP